MRQATLARGRLAEHPVWSRALANPDLAGRVILPVIVGSAIEDREKVEAAPWLERLSLTEVVREARSAAAAGLAGLLLFGMSDRKDEHAILASEPDHVVPRAIRAVKEAVPELGVVSDVCVCAYTAHGQCVLFGEHGADVPATLERLAAISDRPLFSYFTADEHAPFVATIEGPLDPAAAEREHLAAARRAGAGFVISSGAWGVTES